MLTSVSVDRCVSFVRVVHLGSGALKGGTSRPKLSIVRCPIAYKYHEGKMKSTLKRELEAFDITQEEAEEITFLTCRLQRRSRNFGGVRRAIEYIVVGVVFLSEENGA